MSRVAGFNQMEATYQAGMLTLAESEHNESYEASGHSQNPEKFQSIYRGVVLTYYKLGEWMFFQRP